MIILYILDNEEYLHMLQQLFSIFIFTVCLFMQLLQNFFPQKSHSSMNIYFHNNTNCITSTTAIIT